MVHTRTYEVTNWEDQVIPVCKTQFEVYNGLAAGKGNGISEMFHFRYHYGMPEDTCTMRRIPCACDGCIKTMDSDWSKLQKLTPKEREQYQKDTNCGMAEIVGGLNDWKVCRNIQSLAIRD
jgi:hypothetical protein